MNNFGQKLFHGSGFTAALKFKTSCKAMSHVFPLNERQFPLFYKALWWCNFQPVALCSCSSFHMLSSNTRILSRRGGHYRTNETR